jgi:hypothetical protein
MQKYAGQCTPEQLLLLQQAFDTIWAKRTSDGFKGPTHPHMLREEISIRLMEDFRAHSFNVDESANRVLVSFGVSPVPQANVLQFPKTSDPATD